MRDISREAGITPGLCYHYFDSKQKLFAAALAAYAEECCRGYIRVLDDASISLDEKIERLFAAVFEEENLRYRRAIGNSIGSSPSSCATASGRTWWPR